LVCHLYKIPDHPAYFKAACEQLRVNPPSLACRDVTEYYYSLLEPCPAPDEYCPQLDFDFDKKTIMTAPYAELVRGEAQRVGSAWVCLAVLAVRGNLSLTSLSGAVVGVLL
jgi:hypothetical protein